MNPKITEMDVFLYHADKLDRGFRRAIEAAYETDPQVRKWYDDLAPTEKSPVRVPLLDLSDPTVARLASAAFEIVAREDEFDRWVEWAEKPTPALPVPDVGLNRLHLARSGMVYRNEVPMHLGTHSAIGIPPVTCPCIEPDYAREYLTIRQPLDALPDGRIDIIAVRLGDVPVNYTTKGRQLERADAYWYDDIPLASILPHSWKPGETFVYVVKAATAPDHNPDAGD